MRRWWRHSTSACRSSPRPRRTSTCRAAHRLARRRARRTGRVRVTVDDVERAIVASSVSRESAPKIRHICDSSPVPPRSSASRSVDSPVLSEVPTPTIRCGASEGRLQDQAIADAGHPTPPDQPGAGGETARRQQTARAKQLLNPCPGEPRTGERRADAQPAARVGRPSVGIGRVGHQGCRPRSCPEGESAPRPSPPAGSPTTCRSTCRRPRRTGLRHHGNSRLRSPARPAAQAGAAASASGWRAPAAPADHDPAELGSRSRSQHRFVNPHR